MLVSIIIMHMIFVLSYLLLLFACLYWWNKCVGWLLKHDTLEESNVEIPIPEFNAFYKHQKIHSSIYCIKRFINQICILNLSLMSWNLFRLTDRWAKCYLLHVCCFPFFIAYDIYNLKIHYIFYFVLLTVMQGV